MTGRPAPPVTGGNVQGMRGGAVHEGTFAGGVPLPVCDVVRARSGYHPTTKAVTCKRCLARRR